MTTTLTSRQFNQDAAGAKRAAEKGPVFITDRGHPAHVLMTFADYEKLTRAPVSLGEALEGPPAFDFDFEPPRLGREPIEPADLD